VKKKTLETEIGSAEQKLAKYKTQQMSVRKNDEYQALGHEIETTQASIGTLEEEEIGVMLAIDEAKKKFSDAKSLEAKHCRNETRIKNLREREVNLSAELKSAQAEVADARKPIDDPRCDFTIGYPCAASPHACRSAVQCGGCHLKVSSDVESESRKSDKLATCDQCGRIVWWSIAKNMSRIQDPGARRRSSERIQKIDPSMPRLRYFLRHMHCSSGESHGPARIWNVELRKSG